MLQRYEDSLGITTHLSHDNIAECLREIAVKHFQTYAFHTLFLFTRINSNQQIIRFVNHHVSIQNTHGETLNNYELNQDFPLLQHIRELFGSQEGLMQNLSVDDFKNPELGKLICPAPSLTLSSNF